VPERYERPEKYMWIEHGDRNAIYAAARVGTPLEGCKMYLPGLPCMDCARGIIQVGIAEVVFDGNRQKEWALTTPRYGPDFERVKILLAEANVTVTEWYAPES
jgi:dCMP deaminase